MLTRSEPGIDAVDDRPPYRPFEVVLARRRTLSTCFVRLTFRGPDLHLFGRDGQDQRIKLIFPAPGANVDAVVRAGTDWYSRWRALPVHERPPFRTFTVRAVRPDERELDVDIALHEPAAGEQPGPALGWVRTASPGDAVVVVGPDVRSRHSAIGIDWHPGKARTLLLAGDETAVPAIAAVLERMAPDRHTTVLIETADPADKTALTSPATLALTWLTRDPAAPGAALLAAVRRWVDEHPDVVATHRSATAQHLDDIDVDTTSLWDTASASTDFYAWLAGEAGTIKALRRALVTDAGIDRRHVAFMGYWRRGRAEST